MYSVSANGQLCIWESDTELDGLIPSETNIVPMLKPDEDMLEIGESEEARGE